MNIKGKITKFDEDKFLVFGWASVAEKDGDTVVDSQGDVIPLVELEKAAHDFVLHSRVGGEMHEVMGVASLVESFVVTPQKLEVLGLAKNALPYGWLVMFKVHDAETWQRIKNGAYKDFSVGGLARRVNNE